MADNPFLPLSFIAGPAILTNATTVLLNGASIRYNLAVGLWRDLQSETHGRQSATGFAFPDSEQAFKLAHQRTVLIVRALNFLYAAVAGFGLSTLTGLAGALLSSEETVRRVEFTKWLTVGAGGFGLICILLAAFTFILESRCTVRLLRLGIHMPRHAPDQRLDV